MKSALLSRGFYRIRQTLNFSTVLELTSSVAPSPKPALAQAPEAYAKADKPIHQ
jgi:hypothetical protein